MSGVLLLIAVLAAWITGVAEARAQGAAGVASDMSFFVTSAGRGFGANLGGLAGADAHCRRLAAAVGRGERAWRAYLSAPASGTEPAVHARNRIGKGPWRNANGLQVAAGVDDLHSEANAIGFETALNERGSRIGPGRHDILTGSNPDGTLVSNGPDATCGGWTSHDQGRAMLGHHNRSGGGQRPTSWNSAHLSRGCSQRALRASLGDGLWYCFAAD